MDSIDQAAFERQMRTRYELSRARDALLGVIPLAALAALACVTGHRPLSTAFVGSVAVLAGGFALWYGRGLQRAFIPGVAAGIIPLACAIGASRLGHVCTGDSCVLVCVPACAIGGLVAGFTVAHASVRSSSRLKFWAAASGLALLTGAMGCACVGFSGVVGLALGFLAGSLPEGVRIAAAARSR